MLKRGKDEPLSTYGFLLAVELLDGGANTPANSAERLADSVSFMEDVGKVDVESLGKITCYDDEVEK